MGLLFLDEDITHPLPTLYILPKSLQLASLFVVTAMHLDTQDRPLGVSLFPFFLLNSSATT